MKHIHFFRKTLGLMLMALFLFSASSLPTLAAAAPSITTLANFPYLMNINSTYTYQLQVDNPSGLPLTYSLTPALAGASIDANGLFTWTPVDGQQGIYSLAFMVSDGVNNSNTAVITIQVSGTSVPPVVSATPIFNTGANNFTIQPGQMISYAVTATSPIGAPLTLSANLLPGATFDPTTGLYTWVASAQDVGQVYTFTITATDGTNSASLVNTVTVVVAPTPVFTNSAYNTTIQVGQSISQQFTATSPIGAQLTMNASLLPGAVFEASTGLYTWTASTTDAGNTYSYTVAVTDGVNSASLLNTVTVAPLPTPTPTPDPTPTPTSTSEHNDKASNDHKSVKSSDNYKSSKDQHKSKH